MTFGWLASSYGNYLFMVGLSLIYAFSIYTHFSGIHFERKTRYWLITGWWGISTISVIWKIHSQTVINFTDTTRRYRMVFDFTGGIDSNRTWHWKVRVSFITIYIHSNEIHNIRGLHRKSWATFFCMRTGKSRRRRVRWQMEPAVVLSLSVL